MGRKGSEMSLERPAIPADIKRELMIECGHRCACCGEPTALEKAHIVFWSQAKEHTFENLIVLCAVCHHRSHDEEWNRRTLGEYKRRPWVARYRSQPDESPRAIAEFQLDLAPEVFGGAERNRVLAAVSAALDICPQQAVIVSIRAGSVIIDIELPQAAVDALRDNKQLQERVRALVAPIEITRITMKSRPQTSEPFDRFTESNTVEKMIIDVARMIEDESQSVTEVSPRRRVLPTPQERKASCWDYVPGSHLPRQLTDVMVESWVREALIKLNPDVAAQPDRADEVIYSLRACNVRVEFDGLVRANENFMAWLPGEKTDR